MGVYNCEDTLEEAILSIVNQTYKNWEFIICDDGSNDSTYEILKKYKEIYKDKMIILQNKENKGLGYTLNQCLKHAKGKYIARMDGDDKSMPNRFEIQLNFLEQNKEYAFVSSSIIYLYEEKYSHHIEKEGTPSIYQFTKGNPFVHPASMIRKELYQVLEGYNESKDKTRVEDYDLWIRAYANGYLGYIIKEPLLVYRDSMHHPEKRKFKYRLNEAKVRMDAVMKLHLPFYHYIYALRPILVGLLPNKLYVYLHKKRLNLSK